MFAFVPTLHTVNQVSCFVDLHLHGRARVCLTISMYVSFEDMWECVCVAPPHSFTVENSLALGHGSDAPLESPRTSDLQLCCDSSSERIGSLSQYLSSASVEWRPDAVRQVSKVSMLGTTGGFKRSEQRLWRANQKGLVYMRIPELECALADDCK